jgi:hypothetical protein
MVHLHPGDRIMARPQKPWSRKQTGWWMVKIDGKPERLIKGPNDEEHRRLAVEKMVELAQLRRVAPQSSNARIVDVIEAFLRHSRVHLADDTHRMNRYYCQLFAEHCGMVLVRDLKPFHITEWITAMMDPERVGRERKVKERFRKAAKTTKERRKIGPDPKPWGETTIYNARKIAFRVFSWAKEEGLLPENPLAGMKRPKPPPRQATWR